MVHEKIFKKEDGSEVKVTVSGYIPTRYNDELVCYNIGIYKKGPGKRKWVGYSGRDNGVTESEIHQAKIEFWLKIKPASQTKEKDFLQALENLFTPAEEKAISKELETFDCHFEDSDPDYAEMMKEAANNEDYEMFARATRAAYQVFKQSIKYKKERQRQIDSGELIDRSGMRRVTGDIPKRPPLEITVSMDDLPQLVRDDEKKTWTTGPL